MICQYLDTVLCAGQVRSSFFKGSSDSNKLLVVYGIIDFRFCEFPGVVSRWVIRLLSSTWDKMAPMSKSEASVLTWKGFVGSACGSTGAVMNACLSELNAFCATEVHKKGVPLQVRAIRGCARVENPLMKPQ